MRLYSKDVHPGLKASYFGTLGILALTILFGILAGVVRWQVGASCSS